MTSTNLKNIDFAPENVILNFRDNNANPPLIRKTINEVSMEGYPLNKDGEKLKLLSVKLHDSNCNISIATPDNLSVHFVDNTSQNFGGFIDEIDHTPVEFVTYHESTGERVFDNDDYDEF